MSMHKVVIAPWLCLLVVLSLDQIATARVVEQLIAVVNGEPYTLSNVSDFAKQKMARSFPTGDLAQINTADREVLEQFITEKLLEAEIREAGISVSDAEIDQYIERVKQNNRLSEEDFRTVLSREGQTLVSYRKAVKSELERNDLINRQVRRKVNITDEDVERYYKLHADQYRADDRARIRHILISLPASADDTQMANASTKAKELYQRIKAGEDFATLARQHSQGAGSSDGGDIGWVKRGTLIGGLEEVAFNKLKVGEVSEPFRTTMGLHIVKLEARDRGNQLPLSKVAPQIKDELTSKALEERFLSWLKTDLRRKHRVDVKLAGVVFRPEDSKERTVESLIARSNRTRRREDERTALSYLNPLSYIVSEKPFEEQDPNNPLYGKSVVSIFGVPLFTTETVEDVPDVLSAPPSSGSAGPAASPLDSAPAKSESPSFFERLNPFSSSK